MANSSRSLFVGDVVLLAVCIIVWTVSMFLAESLKIGW